MIDKNRLLQRCLSALLAATMALMSTYIPLAQAQNVEVLDLRPPVINYDPIPSGRAGDTHVFTAQVLEERSLLSVILYHRFAGDGPYASTEMLPLGNNLFSASVVTDETDVRNIEYYIQAEDADGNRTIKGFSFDPLIKEIISDNAEAIVATAAASSTAASETSGGNRWVWGLLGLVVVAVAAGAASGGGGSGGSTSTIQPSTVVLEVEEL